MKELDSKNFKETTSKGVIIVDFWADWCGPCKLIAPRFEELSHEMEDVVFAKLNVDDSPDVASDNSVMSIPTLIIFKDGKEVDRIVGAGPKEMIKQKIEAFK